MKAPEIRMFFCMFFTSAEIFKYNYIYFEFGFIHSINEEPIFCGTCGWGSNTKSLELSFTFIWVGATVHDQIISMVGGGRRINSNQVFNSSPVTRRRVLNLLWGLCRMSISRVDPKLPNKFKSYLTNYERYSQILNNKYQKIPYKILFKIQFCIKNYSKYRVLIDPWICWSLF